MEKEETKPPVSPHGDLADPLKVHRMSGATELMTAISSPGRQAWVALSFFPI